MLSEACANRLNTGFLIFGAEENTRSDLQLQNKRELINPLSLKSALEQLFGKNADTHTRFYPLENVHNRRGKLLLQLNLVGF